MRLPTRTSLLNEIKAQAIKWELAEITTDASITAKRLGYDATIITKCPPKHPYLTELTHLGIHVHRLKTSNKAITSFKNTYDTRGKRTQYVIAQQKPITLADYDYFPKEILKGSVTLIAPVINEVDIRLLHKLSKAGSLGYQYLLFHRNQLYLPILYYPLSIRF